MKKYEKILHVSFILKHLMIAAQAITPHLLRYFSKYFLHRQHNRYIRFALYTNSLILI